MKTKHKIRLIKQLNKTLKITEHYHNSQELKGLIQVIIINELTTINYKK